jgi:hypothetical protein
MIPPFSSCIRTGLAAAVPVVVLLGLGASFHVRADDAAVLGLVAAMLVWFQAGALGWMVPRGGE